MAPIANYLIKWIFPEFTCHIDIFRLFNEKDVQNYFN